jgi:hypothetical protein
MNGLVTIGLCFLGNLKIVHLPFQQISRPLCPLYTGLTVWLI